MSNQNQQLAVLQKDITDEVSGKLAELENGGLALPPNYNPHNALKSAFFKLQEVKDRNNKPALEVCTKASIANALLDMVVQGLSPAKTQCYFVVYGTQLQLLRSYFGTQAVLKRLNNVEDIWANVIYEGDEFNYEITDGRERLVEHKTHFLNRDNKILGAYAVIKKSDGDEVLTVMTRKEIEASWSQSSSESQHVHKKFPQEMAKRTVINRAAKHFINTSDDSDLLVDAINRSTENEYERERKDVTPEQEVQQQIEQNANTEELDIQQEPEEIEIIDPPQKDEAPHQEFLKDVAQKKQQESLFDDEGPAF